MGLKAVDLKDEKLRSEAIICLGLLPEAPPRSKGPKAKVGLRATKMVASVARRVASVKEEATLPLPKEPGPIHQRWPGEYPQVMNRLLPCG